MSSISKVLLVCTLGLGLTACATPDYVFKKLDASQMDFQNDLNKATVMGAAAFQRGILCSCASDVEFSYFIKKYSTSDWKFTKQLLKLMDAWQRGYTIENLK